MNFAGGQPLAVGNVSSVAIGNDAMRFASGSQQNVALGNNVLKYTSGSNNMALGAEAMANNINGSQNVAIGVGALNANINGSRNIAIGNDCAIAASGSDNTYIGASAGSQVTGSSNVIIGRYQGSSGTVLNNNIILADGQGNVKAQYSGSAWSLQGEIKLNVGGNNDSKPAGIGSVNTDGSGDGTFYNSLIIPTSVVMLTSQGSYRISVGTCSTGSVAINSSLGSSGVGFTYLIINPTV